MSELVPKLVQAYKENDLAKCKELLLFLVLDYNSNCNKGEDYNHDLKHLLFTVNFIRNPLGTKYTEEDYNNIEAILLDTIKILNAINDPEVDTSNVFRKELVIDKKIIDDLVGLTMYTHAFHHMNQLNSKRMVLVWTLPVPLRTSSTVASQAPFQQKPLCSFNSNAMELPSGARLFLS